MFTLNTNEIVFAYSKQGAQKLHEEFKEGVINIYGLVNLLFKSLL